MDVLLSDAHAGMVLAEDVIISGGVLAHRQEVLDATTITLLKNCGIVRITICDPGDDTASSNSVQYASPGGTIPPEIHLSINRNGMTAQLVLDPIDGIDHVITGQTIRKVLAANGIIYGINERRIDEIARQWNEKKQMYVVERIAEGDPPHPAIEGAVALHFRHITSKSAYEQVRLQHLFRDAVKIFPDIEGVPAGSVLAERNTEHPATPGIDIFGNQLSCESNPFTSAMVPGEHVVVREDGQAIIAQCDGIAYCFDDTIGIIPMSFDGSFGIEIASDRMSVRCTVCPPALQGKLPGKAFLLAMLKDASVHFGINENDIDTLLSLCNNGACPAEPVVIARGLPPVNGTDGRCTFHFKTETSLAPAINSDGSADYKSLNIVTTVERNKVLVTLVPPGTGQDGSDVFGKVHPAQPGHPVKLPQGAHTIVDPHDPTALRAEIDGIVRITSGLVEVCEGFVVEGDVDFSTGNIDYAKTVVVNGDVTSGFDIHAGADIQINGTVEDCHITAGGNVLCRCGFVGQGRGSIEAKGDVNLNFVKNQSVRSFKSIGVAKEILNSTLLSRTSIVAHGKPLSVAGGELRAKQSITAYSVGNQTGIKTLLEAGVDYLMVDECTMLEQQISDTAAQVKSATEVLSRFMKSVSHKKQMSPGEQGKHEELTGAIKHARQRLTVLEERRAIVAGKIYNVKDARIVIEHAAYPGTLFKFGERHHALKEELIGPKTIIYADHEIKII